MRQPGGDAEMDVWAELELILREDAPTASCCDSSQAFPESTEPSQPQSFAAVVNNSSRDARSTSRHPPRAQCDGSESSASGHRSSATCPAASRRKQSRQFVIVDMVDAPEWHKTDDTFLSEGRPVSSPPKSKALSHSSPVLASSDGALSRCATATTSPQHRHRAVTVQDSEESVCESSMGLGGRCISTLTLQCSLEASAHDSKKSFHEGIAPNHTSSENRSALASPNRTEVSWAVEADPDMLGCQDLRAAISVLQLRIRELEK